MRLDCGKAIIRDWQQGDKNSLLYYANDRNIWRNLTHKFPHPYTVADADDWLTYVKSMKEPTHWAIEVEERCAGCIGITLRDGIFIKTAEFGYWLAEPHWGRGIMSAVIPLVSQYATQQFGLVRLESRVFSWNPASMRVLEKSGFVREGRLRASAFKDGQVIDEVLYALVVEPSAETAGK